MELFPAADVNQLDYIKKIIDECDYYVLILGGRYGSMDESGVSYTEREYDYAVQSGKVVLAFVHDDVEAIAVRNSEANHAAKLALAAFREKVMTGRLVRGWRDQQSLELAVLKALMHAFSDFPKVGWVRGDAIASQETIEKYNRILEENAGLKKKISDDESRVRILSNIENLAGLDDEFEVRYSYRSLRASGGYPNTSKKISWKRIFLGVGAQLDLARTDAAILNGVRMALKDFDGSSVYLIDQTDKVRIKIQLEALGLITTKVSKTLEGGYAEFISLTSMGRRVLIEGLVVRKPSNE